MLLALVMNGLEATPAGGSVRLSARPEPDGGGLVLAVADTGCGIPPEDQARIFEPFFTTKEQGKGVGLGLAVVYGIVNRHHGRIELRVASRGDRVHGPSAGAPAGRRPRNGGPLMTDPPHAPLRILVVDDETIVRESLSAWLRQDGHAVDVAENAKEALRLAAQEPARHRARGHQDAGHGRPGPPDRTSPPPTPSWPSS